jgi:hypothetical protein
VKPEEMTTESATLVKFPKTKMVVMEAMAMAMVPPITTMLAPVCLADAETDMPLEPLGVYVDTLHPTIPITHTMHPMLSLIPMQILVYLIKMLT